MNKATKIERAREYGRKAKNLVVAKEQCPAGDREALLIGYWALIFDFHNGILLLENGFNGSAFALVRPIVEALVRAHVSLIGTNKDIAALQADDYRTNFGTIGDEIDNAFELGGLMQKFLDGAKNALHSYTHSGTLQLGRQFTDSDVVQNYSDDEVLEIVNISTSAVFMVTTIVTKHFNFEDEWKSNDQLFDEWDMHPA